MVSTLADNVSARPAPLSVNSEQETPLFGSTTSDDCEQRQLHGRCATFRDTCRCRRAVPVVDLFKRAALGFEPERPEPDHAEDVPHGEVTQCRAEHDEVGRGGPDHITRTHDKRQTERPDELAAMFQDAMSYW